LIAVLLASFPIQSALGQIMQEGASISERYRAYIGKEDEFNSFGRRLHYFHEVIEQDRANIHAFDKSQPGDEVDSVFGEYALRRKLASAILDSGATKLISEGLRGSRFFLITVTSDDEGNFNVTVEEEDPATASLRVRACAMREIEGGQCDGITF